MILSKGPCKHKKLVKLCIMAFKERVAANPKKLYYNVKPVKRV